MMQWLHTLQMHNFYETKGRLQPTRPQGMSTATDTDSASPVELLPDTPDPAMSENNVVNTNSDVPDSITNCTR